MYANLIQISTKIGFFKKLIHILSYFKPDKNFKKRQNQIDKYFQFFCHLPRENAFARTKYKYFINIFNPIWAQLTVGMKARKKDKRPVASL